MSLDAGDFSNVFKAIHGDEPYLWQRRLLAHVIAEGWPGTIAAPTGAGKTAVLDVALFHLALEAEALLHRAEVSARQAPLRIVLAVDRRVVVDQAFDRAKKIGAKLEAATEGPPAAMKAALKSLSGAEPLHVEELRGGMPREDDWAKSPTQPTILCTTVDQLGSRLLFRGYGVSEAMAPIHAGLLGQDTLVILDEAHLSSAFSKTLGRIASLRDRAKQPLGLPFAVTELTATPRSREGVFELTDDERAEKEIKKRLSAEKRARCEELNLKKAKAAQESDGEAETDGEDEVDSAKALEKAASLFAEAAQNFGGDADPAPLVAVVVNRVALAREIHKKLAGPAAPAAASAAGETEKAAEAAAPKPREDTAILLTGRVRPTERDELIRKHRDRLEGKETSTLRFVVATQCIEAGADFDFDAMVTQIAPLDALAQRFGRLARQGKKAGQAAILALPSDIAKKTNDPVYGDRMLKTWEWLRKAAAAAAPAGEVAEAKKPKGKAGEQTIDLGPDQLSARIAADPEGANACCAEAQPAPFLRAADLDFFSMTNPAPYPDPHLPLYLHGDPRIETDVGIVWRADLGEEDFAKENSEEEGAWANEIVAAMPPRPGEALLVPIAAARAWLGQARAAAVADAPQRDDQGGPIRDSRKALRWRRKDAEVGSARDVRPGDVLVVPASYGGCDRFGWLPDREEPVEDIADKAADAYSAKRLALRLHPALWRKAAGEAAAWDGVAALIADAEDRRVGAPGLIDALLAHLADTPHAPPAHLSEWLKTIRKRSPKLLWPYRPDEEERPIGVVIVAGRGVVESDDDDESSFIAARQFLKTHVAAVERHVERSAKPLRLPTPVASALALAARHHDDGKADERFQAYLGARAGELLAKSGQRYSWAEDRIVRGRAGLPSPWRHEALSARLFAARHGTDAGSGADLDLALWLIGTHHGQGRPFFRHDDPWDRAGRPLLDMRLEAGPGPGRLDFDWRGGGWADLFEALKARYGVWGLAYLEAVLRLADHRASEEAPAEESHGAQAQGGSAGA